MSPEFTAKEPGTYRTSTQSPSGIRTWSPGTSVWARKVMKLASVCGAMPNWFASAATGGVGATRKLNQISGDAAAKVIIGRPNAAAHSRHDPPATPTAAAVEAG